MDIITVFPPGLMRSPLTVLNSRESYINVTWTPSPSQQGSNSFCYAATDNFGCVETMLANAAFMQYVIKVDILHQLRHYILWNRVLFTLFMVVSSFILLFRLTSPTRCITLAVGGKHQTNTAVRVITCSAHV